MSVIFHLKQLFGSNMKAQEALLVWNEIKPCLRQLFYESELPAIREFCENQGLSLFESDFYVRLDSNGFTNKGERTQNKSNLKVVYISQQSIIAELARDAEKVNDHVSLGKLLGYPECCIRYFITHFSSLNFNPQIKCDGLLNISKREDDICLLSHFPCSCNCNKSHQIAQEYLQELERVDGEYTKKLKNQLNV